MLQSRAGGDEDGRKTGTGRDKEGRGPQGGARSMRMRHTGMGVGNKRGCSGARTGDGGGA